jgi:hypothetical protein
MIQDPLIPHVGRGKGGTSQDLSQGRKDNDMDVV